MRFHAGDAAAAKQLVQQSYDCCAADYSAARRRDPSPELALLTDRLHDGARVLDIGCGAGVPVAQSLAKRFVVTGVDLSSEQIRLARANVPDATLLQGDIMAMDFAPASFDAVVAFYSIFHLPREEHPALFDRIATWLAPGGYLLCTVSQESEAGYQDDDFFGVTMYWSNYGLADYQRMLSERGFRLLDTQIVGHGYNDQNSEAESHPLMFAQKTT